MTGQNGSANGHAPGFDEPLRAKVDLERPLLYPEYLPTKATQFHPPPAAFDHNDPALRADPSLPVFYHSPGVVLTEYTPKFGTKVTGLQLADLDEVGLDQLGLLVAQRGVVVFSSTSDVKQNYRDVGIPRQLEIGRHFGKLNQLPGGIIPAGQPEISIVFQDKVNQDRAKNWANQLSMTHWHRDQSQEPQPAGVTFFVCLEQSGSSGGDTLFANCVEAYERLSPKVQEFLVGLRGFYSTAGAAVHRGAQDVVETSHPLVIHHPVTGKRAIYVDTPNLMTHIEGLRKEESKKVHEFLLTHIATGQDFQIRVRWEEGDIAVWDQRAVLHSATMDTVPNERRHFARIMALAGAPIEAKTAHD